MGFSRVLVGGLCAASLLLLLSHDAFADVNHVVAKGHTLKTIAARYHISTRALLEANPNVNPKRLAIGQVLLIPGVGPKTAPGAKSPPGAKAAAPGQPGKGVEQTKGGTPGVSPATVGPVTTGGGSTLAAPAPQPGKSGVAAGGAHGRDPYAGKAKHPGLVHLLRFGSNEEATVNVKAGGKVPHAALVQFKKLMHSSSGQVHDPDPRLVALLGIVSNHFGGKRIEIISGYRPFSPKQYTPHSNHNHGRAIDFRIQGVPNSVLRDFCKTLHNVGVGYYPNSVFVHLDVRATPAFWIDYSKPGEPPRYQTPTKDADEGASDVHNEQPTLNPAPAAPGPEASEGTPPAVLPPAPPATAGTPPEKGKLAVPVPAPMPGSPTP